MRSNDDVMENQTPISPVFTPQIVVEQPKSNSFLIILLSSLLFISCLIAGFFAYQTQKLVKELTNLKTAPTTEVTVEPTPDPTADWKTYSGKIFTFKYPVDMDIKRQDTQDPDNPKNIGDLVELSNNRYKLQVSSDFMGGWGGSVCLINKNQKIDGHDSQLLYFRHSKPGTEICLDKYAGLVALVENSVFQHPYPILIDLQPKEANGVVELDFFDQILSTFKFTN